MKTIGDVNLNTGKIDNVLTVNKDRIYMAGVGAVKELSGMSFLDLAMKTFKKSESSTLLSHWRSINAIFDTDFNLTEVQTPRYH